VFATVEWKVLDVFSVSPSVASLVTRVTVILKEANYTAADS
jgi:hypothetical protein